MSKKNVKTEAQVMAEKQEAEDLASSILGMTTRIPEKIINDAGANLVRQYKKAAAKAVSVANLRNKNLTKLREAHSLIKQFYI
jgi:hypothetical protein